MATMAGTGISQEPGASSDSHVGAAAQAHGPSLLLCQVHQQGAGLYVEQWKLEPVPIQAAGSAGDGLAAPEQLWRGFPRGCLSPA